MRYAPADIDALHAPAVMEAVLERYAMPRGAANGKPRYTCPCHAHKHPDKPHLRMEIGKGGRAMAVCDSYGVIGDVFELVGQLEGMQDFPARVEAVADIAGYRLPDDDASPRRVKAAGKGKDTRPTGLRPDRPAGDTTLSKRETPTEEYLPPDEECAAWQAVERLAASPDAVAHYAALLGVPGNALHAHTDKDCIALGLLGLDPAGRLLYVYTARDAAGAWRVPLYKARALPGETPRFRAHGRKAGLWGIEALGDARRVIITEGESDALAVRAAVWSWADMWVHCNPDSFDPASIPAIVAKPDAGTFKAAWAAPLRGRDVILCIDADDAGLEGAARTAKTLHAAGVRRVYQWRPPDGVKDARAALDAARPWRLADDIFTRKEIER